MGDTGKSRLRALLQGLVDYVVSPEGGSYVLGGGGSCRAHFQWQRDVGCIDIRSGNRGRTLPIKDPLIHVSVLMHK